MMSAGDGQTQTEGRVRLRLTVGRKLALSFALICGLICLAIAVAISGMSSMNSKNAAIVGKAVPKQLAADEAKAAGSDMHFSQTEYALGKLSARANYLQDRATFGAAVSKLGKLSVTPAHKPALAASQVAA